MISYLELIKKYPDASGDILKLKHSKDYLISIMSLGTLFLGFLIGWLL